MNVVASDINESLILLWQEVQKRGTEWLPDFVSENEYKEFRDAKDTSQPSPMKAFVGIAASYGGKWYGGYARDKTGRRNFVKEAKEAISKRLPLLTTVKFEHKSYLEYGNLKDSVIICDPPYSDTTDGYCDKEMFDSKQFWEWVTELSKANKVFVCEYNAPENFTSIMKKVQGTSLNNSGGEKQPKRIEQLFVLDSYL